MRSPKKAREIAAGGAPSNVRNRATNCSPTAKPVASKPPETLAELPPADFTSGPGSRSSWVYLPKGRVRRPAEESDTRASQFPDKRDPSTHQCVNGPVATERSKREGESAYPTAALYQDSFFFCKIGGLGDVPGTGRIYVETVVERDSGIAFAKVYSTKNALNAVDLLSSRVGPLFARYGIAIEEIYTPKTREYCGVPPAHPYETFLAASHIRHLHLDQATETYRDLCDRFYTNLLNGFLLPALRKKFHLSLDELQKDLDGFIETYNAERVKQLVEFRRNPSP